MAESVSATIWKGDNVLDTQQQTRATFCAKGEIAQRQVPRATEYRPQTLSPNLGTSNMCHSGFQKCCRIVTAV